MRYDVWFVKYERVTVEADNEDEAIDLANDRLDEIDDSNEYEFSDIECLDE